MSSLTWLWLHFNFTSSSLTSRCLEQVSEFIRNEKKFFLYFFHSFQEATANGNAAGVTTQHPTAKHCAVRQLHRDLQFLPMSPVHVHTHVQKCSCELAENSDVKCFKFFLTAHKQNINTSTATAQRGRHKKNRTLLFSTWPLWSTQTQKPVECGWLTGGGLGQSVSCSGRGEAEGGALTVLEEWTLPQMAQNLSTPSVMQATPAWCSQHHVDQIIWHCSRGGKKQSRNTLLLHLVDLVY